LFINVLVVLYKLFVCVMLASSFVLWLQPHKHQQCCYISHLQLFHGLFYILASSTSQFFICVDVYTSFIILSICSFKFFIFLIFFCFDVCWFHPLCFFNANARVPLFIAFFHGASVCVVATRNKIRHLWSNSSFILNFFFVYVPCFVLFVSTCFAFTCFCFLQCKFLLM
jgi:hypothetical protein